MVTAEKFPTLLSAYQLGLITFDIKYNVTLESLSYRGEKAYEGTPDHDRIAWIDAEIGIRYKEHTESLHIKYSVHLNCPTLFSQDIPNIDYDTVAHYVGLHYKKKKVWEKIITDFSKVKYINVYGLNLPIIERQELIAYKKLLARPVDLVDLEYLEHNL